MHDPRRYLGRLISILDRHADRFVRSEFAGHGIGKAHLQFLGSMVMDGDGVSQEELAQRLLMDKSAVARSLSRLEGLGFLRREIDGQDARRNRILLTPKARRLWPEVLAGLESWNTILTRGFTAAEERAATELLDRMVSNAILHTMGRAQESGPEAGRQE